MIKDFENYEKKQRLAGGQTQWKKIYDEGGYTLEAWAVISDYKVTRAKVQEAFLMQEDGEYEIRRGLI